MTFLPPLLLFFFFPFSHEITILYVYICCAICESYARTVRNFSSLFFAQNRVTRVGHISSFNETQQQSIEAKRFEGVTFDLLFLPKNPSFLSFSPSCYSVPLRTLRSKSRRRIRGIEPAPIHRTSKQAFASWHKSHRHLSPSPRF